MAKADDLSSPYKTTVHISKSTKKWAQKWGVLENNLDFYLRAVSINIMDGRLGF